MELYQKQLLNILYSSINGEKFSCNSEKKIEWEKVIKEATDHELSALIYSSITKDTLKEINKDVLNKWKVSILNSNITQIKILKCAKDILLGLEKKGVQVIALKGLILKKFYPRPEFRTMSDLDILIDIKDYNLVKEYLFTMGYTCEDGNTPIHAEFYSENGPVIEVHWKLVNKDYYIGDEKEFEENLWKNSKEIYIHDFMIRTLSDEDFLVHICIHMAVHVKYKGFGLRQLYDLALFSKNKRDDIDWGKFRDKISKYGILTFTEGLYALCSKLFEIEIPFFIVSNSTLKEEHIELLLENIIYSGVNGSRHENIDFNILYKSNNWYSKIEKIVRIIFVGTKELSPRYEYAKKHFYLLPVAWVHRMFRAIFKKYGLTKLFKYTNEAMEIGQKKSEILNIFKL